MDVIVNTHGTRVRCTSERLVLTSPTSQEKTEYPIRRVKKIVIMVSASISSEAVHLALEHGVDIVFMNHYGRPAGRIFPSTPKGTGNLRRAQLRYSDSPERLNLALQLVLAKVQSQYCLLESLAAGEKRDLSSYLKQINQVYTTLQFEKLCSESRLLGFEGRAAEQYFSGLRQLCDFPGRDVEGSDIYNSCLNYGYGILYNEMERACQIAGLDPYVGVYHKERYGKPSLVLDMVEEFRVAVVDSVLFPLFINKTITKKRNIAVSEGKQRLSPAGKKAVLNAVYQRLHEKFLWNGKKLELQNIILQQPVMMGQYFEGKKLEYAPFVFAHHHISI